MSSDSLFPDYPPFVPKGIFKTFGPLGPAYEVGLPVRQLENGDWLVDITVLESGEKLEYPLTSVFFDPDA
jgi:Family of unknown function (DUF5397)